VLEVIQSGINTPTHIMYASNLSWNPVEDTLTTLIQGDFIRKRGTGRTKRYYITEKGARVLRYHQKSMEELQPATPEIKLSEINNLSLARAKH
jgi:predicted transcriptional regulator